jgi:hypothetical protein
MRKGLQLPALFTIGTSIEVPKDDKSVFRYLTTELYLQAL